MEYEAAVRYLMSLADFERTGRFQERADAGPMRSLLRELGDPQVGRLTVHVAGSKGKGSVAAMVESVLRAAGLRTGLYTSPHLHEFTERVRLDGRPISEPEFARHVCRLREVIEAAGAPWVERIVTFDLLTALGFLAFRGHGAEAQVVEVGLGGRVDQTNVFETKEVAVITALSFEHTAILGDTIEAIAAEKAGIITPGCTVVLGRQVFPEAAAVVREQALSVGAQVIDVADGYEVAVPEHDLRGQNVRIAGPRGVVEARLPLLGAHQAENAATAVAVADALRSRGVDITVAQVRQGLETVYWPGRLEILRERPRVIADGAHNRESARRLREALGEYFGAERVTFVIGASGDKDIDGMAEELAPLAGRVFATRTSHPRAMAPKRIVEAFSRAGRDAENVDSIGAAIEAAMAATEESGLICLAGSLIVAAEGREYLGKRGEPVGGENGRH